MLRFLERLPNHGHYKAALADDDEYAARMLAQFGQRKPPMTMAGYDHIAMRLDTLIDVLIAANSTGTPVKMPRPVTAFDRVETRAVRSRHQQRVAMVLGHGVPTTG